ncbi:tRNA1(Val) (adenine(37)-N6)-methyltransferase [Defluviitalea phaphyphila]|uniref:tRNA1(Val) (adenine(37)-N6)-methyltransferase n=1 Tax=Defluviitalea phaphyphila TaxID=1473580 RepID=UPI0007317DC5|nr:tRNA1(Val) (adenine(37)-N6)-methyltransferase [Defluviitalea phaphyphila]
MKKINLKKGERIDDLNLKGYNIIQNPNFFCFGMDAVLLSSFTKIKDGEVVLDLGSGNGIIPILLEAKTKGKKFIGLEIQEENVDMARRSILLNDIKEKVEVHIGDIKKIKDYYKANSFDVVTSNPPYMNNGGGFHNLNEAKTIARHEVLCSLEDVIYAASYVLKNKGRFYMVHRPHRLVDIIVLLRKYHLEPKTLRMVHPYINKEPNMVLIEAIKNAKALLKVLNPIIVYKKEGQYTDELLKLYGMKGSI